MIVKETATDDWTQQLRKQHKKFLMSHIKLKRYCVAAIEVQATLSAIPKGLWCLTLGHENTSHFGRIKFVQTSHSKWFSFATKTIRTLNDLKMAEYWRSSLLLTLTCCELSFKRVIEWNTGDDHHMLMIVRSMIITRKFFVATR